MAKHDPAMLSNRFKPTVLNGHRLEESRQKPWYAPILLKLCSITIVSLHVLKILSMLLTLARYDCQLSLH